MEPEKKIYKLDELNQMSHEALVEAYLILASYTMELLSRIMSMQDDYDALAESVRESESIFEQLAKMLPSLLTQLNRLEARVFGTHSTSYSNTVNKKLKRAKVLEIMQAINLRSKQFWSYTGLISMLTCAKFTRYINLLVQG